MFDFRIEDDVCVEEKSEKWWRTVLYRRLTTDEEVASGSASEGLKHV